MQRPDGFQTRGAAPAGVWPYSEDVNQYSQDLEKAAELLAEAGHAEGFDMRLSEYSFHGISMFVWSVREDDLMKNRVGLSSPIKDLR